MEYSRQSVLDLIIKSLKGTLTDDERAVFEKWAGDPGNDRLYHRIVRLWNETRRKASVSCPDENAAWRRIVRIIDRPAGKSRRLVYAAAACAAAVLVSGLSWYALSDMDSPSGDSISFSNVAGKTVALLPDSSEVWLRNGANVRYAGNFGKRTRNVSLSGEAFFDVSKDPSKPFRINVSGLGIEVLGTSFDVKECRDRVEVSLVEGTVKLIPDCIDSGDFTKDSDGIQVITAGEIASYVKSSGAISVRRGDTAHHALWAKDRLSFRDENIESVCRDLSVWYGVKIDIIAETDYVARLSFTVTDEPLDIILSLIHRACPDIGYRYLEDGSVQIF